MKRFLNFSLALSLVLGLVPAFQVEAEAAASNIFEEKGVVSGNTLKVENETVSVTDGRSDLSNVIWSDFYDAGTKSTRTTGGRRYTYTSEYDYCPWSGCGARRGHTYNITSTNDLVSHYTAGYFTTQTTQIGTYGQYDYRYYEYTYTGGTVSPETRSGDIYLVYDAKVITTTERPNGYTRYWSGADFGGRCSCGRDYVRNTLESSYEYYISKSSTSSDRSGDQEVRIDNAVFTNSTVNLSRDFYSRIPITITGSTLTLNYRSSSTPTHTHFLSSQGNDKANINITNSTVNTSGASTLGLAYTGTVNFTGNTVGGAGTLNLEVGTGTSRVNLNNCTFNIPVTINTAAPCVIDLTGVSGTVNINYTGTHGQPLVLSNGQKQLSGTITVGGNISQAVNLTKYRNLIFSALNATSITDLTLNNTTNVTATVKGMTGTLNINSASNMNVTIANGYRKPFTVTSSMSGILNLNNMGNQALSMTGGNMTSLTATGTSSINITGGSVHAGTLSSKDKVSIQNTLNVTGTGALKVTGNSIDIANAMIPAVTATVNGGSLTMNRPRTNGLLTISGKPESIRIERLISKAGVNINATTKEQYGGIELLNCAATELRAPTYSEVIIDGGTYSGRRAI